MNKIFYCYYSPAPGMGTGARAVGHGQWISGARAVGHWGTSSGSVGHGQWGTGTRAVKQWGTGARAVDQWSSGRLSINIHLYVCCIVHTQHRHYSRQILLTYGIEKCQKNVQTKLSRVAQFLSVPPKNWTKTGQQQYCDCGYVLHEWSQFA